MKIDFLGTSGVDAALLGLGLSYGLTSEYSSMYYVPEETKKRLYQIAGKLACKGGGEDKFLRQIVYWWDATFPRFLWQEVDQYRIGVTTQSESTIHTIMHRELTQDDFEYDISLFQLDYLNRLIAKYKETKSEEAFLKLKNGLPEGFLQRRVWSLSLANMKNIYAQRHRHRLPQWHLVCQAFVDATPGFLQGIYDGAD